MTRSILVGDVNLKTLIKRGTQTIMRGRFQELSIHKVGFIIRSLNNVIA